MQRRVLSAGPPARPIVDICKFLDHAARPEDCDSQICRQNVYLTEQLAAWHQHEASTRTVAIADVSRDPFRKMDSALAVGCARTLRTNCSHMWILPGPPPEHIFWPRVCFLIRAEKCRVAGVVPSSLSSLSDSDVDVVLGNTIPVPLAGHVLFPVLCAWIEIVRPQMPNL